MRGDESFADDLNVELGTVSSEVALLLRRAEVILGSQDLCSIAHLSLPPIVGPGLESDGVRTGGRGLPIMEGRELVLPSDGAR